MKTKILKPEHSLVKERKVARRLYACIIAAGLVAGLFFLMSGQTVSTQNTSHPKSLWNK